MIIDKECVLATGAAFDLESVRPGPGQPLRMIGVNLPAGDMKVTMSDTAGGTYTACTTITAKATDKLIEFELPSNTQQFIKATFASGDVMFVMEGNQTAV